MNQLKYLEEVYGEIINNPYRRYYIQNSKAYQTPVRNWMEFCERFSETELEFDMPSEAPTYINTFLDESFFASERDDVALVINCAYCPPFLHRLAFIKVVYVLRGSCYLLINGEKLRMDEGMFCLVGPNVEQAVYSCHDEDIVVNLLMRFRTFSESFLSLMQEQDSMSDFFWRMLYGKPENECLIYRGRKEPVLTENILELCDEILQDDKTKSNLIRKSLLMIFYGNVLRLHAKDLFIIGTKRKKGYKFPRILLYMNNNLNCTLPSLADEFGFSTGYISRYIARESGKSFQALMREFRMRQAARMLRNTDFLSIKL